MSDIEKNEELASSPQTDAEKPVEQPPAQASGDTPPSADDNQPTDTPASAPEAAPAAAQEPEISLKTGAEDASPVSPADDGTVKKASAPLAADAPAAGTDKDAAEPREGAVGHKPPGPDPLKSGYNRYSRIEGDGSDRKREGKSEEGSAPWRSTYSRTGTGGGGSSDGRGDDRRGGFRNGRMRGGRIYTRHRIDRIQAQKLNISYRHPDILRKFITERGKILPRRITGNSAKGQRKLTQEIKRARFLALLPMG